MSNMRQKIFSWLLVMALVIGLLPAITLTASAASSGTCGENAYWEYNEQTKTITVSGTGPISSYKHEGCGPWREYISEVEKIIIEEGITAVGYSAFEGCYKLKDLELPDSMLFIDQNGFYNCESSLDRVVIPPNLIYFGCNAFAGWTNGYEPYHITYVYFLGNAPELISVGGKISNTFSEFTTLYYLEGTSGWSGPTWNGYHIEPWDGENFIDPYFTGQGGTGTQNPDVDACDITVRVTGKECYTYAYDIINQVNELRSSLGLDELKIDEKLMDVAMQRAAECSVYYSHDRPNDTSSTDIFPRASLVGENIAAGQTSPNIVMSQWTASPGHYANMTEERFTNIGVGCFYINGTYYWTQAFSNGSLSRADRQQDQEVTVAVPVNDNHFLLATDTTRLTLKVGQSKQVPVYLLNTGFGNEKTPISAYSVRGSWQSDIVDLDVGTLTVTGVAPGTTYMRVTLGDIYDIDYQVTVQDLFTDVPQNSWYSDAVQYVYNEGIMSGTSETTFSPNLPTTRGMIVTILYRLEGQPGAGYSYFYDVQPNDWYADAVSWAAENGIISGYGNSRFGPNDAVTREQLAVILYNYVQFKGYPTNSYNNLSYFSDASEVSPFALRALQWANYEGLINGMGNGEIKPKATASRAQTAIILWSLCLVHSAQAGGH